MDLRKIAIRDYSYELPAEKIAHYPADVRDASRLLVYRDDTITEDHYYNIDAYLPENSLLLFNDTRVVAARLLFRKDTGATIEIFCLEPHAQYADMNIAMSQQQEVTWMCLIGGASKWKPGQVLQKDIFYNGETITLEATWLAKEKDCFAVRLSWNDDQLSFAEVLQLAGNVPLPPYIKRKAETVDAERYQTIYAKQEGSVAAPTAGLHFTDRVFEKLDRKKIQRAYVTLHVGAGTFKPVKSETMETHDMHTEWIDVPIASIETILQHLNSHITVVGTTSLRTVESLYWFGVKILQQPVINTDDLLVQQWDPYQDTGMDISPENAIQALLDWMRARNMKRLFARTQLLIGPGYTIRIPKALVTNFHQPQSTLLLLVAAFAGPGWRRVYDHALENDFRFLSYGDGCLLFRAQ